MRALTLPLLMLFACDGGEPTMRVSARLVAAARRPMVAGDGRPHCSDAGLRDRLPLADLSPAQIAERVRDDPESLGSASIGSATRGALWNGVRLRSSDHIEAVTEPYAWATAGTVAAIERAARIVRCRFPGSHRLHVGSLSRRQGGPLFPHRSHQSGLDADVGYFYTSGPEWYAHATRDNLDVERTWALIEVLYDGGNVEYLFIDRRVQALLREHAEVVTPELITPLFDGTPQKQPTSGTRAGTPRICTCASMTARPSRTPSVSCRTSRGRIVSPGIAEAAVRGGLAGAWRRGRSARAASGARGPDRSARASRDSS